MIAEDGGGRASLGFIHGITSLENLYNKRPSALAEGPDVIYYEFPAP